MMNRWCNVIGFILVTVCLSEVFAKNVDNHRSKRTAEDFGHSCENVKPFFEMRNISLPSVDEPKGKCTDFNTINMHGFL